jgi:hypothetical protein
VENDILHVHSYQNGGIYEVYHMILLQADNELQENLHRSESKQNIRNNRTQKKRNNLL